MNPPIHHLCLILIIIANDAVRRYNSFDQAYVCPNPLIISTCTVLVRWLYPLREHKVYILMYTPFSCELPLFGHACESLFLAS